MIKLPAYLTGFSSKTDGSASLRFATQEVSGEDFSNFKKDLNSYGWIYFRPNEIKLDELPEEDAPREDFEKSPSKRLYDVLFVYFMEVKKGEKSQFSEFYRKEIENIISHIKHKLD